MDDPSDKAALSELLFWAEEKRGRQTRLNRKYLVMIVGFGSKNYQINLNSAPGFQIIFIPTYNLQTALIPKGFLLIL